MHDYKIVGERLHGLRIEWQRQQKENGNRNCKAVDFAHYMNIESSQSIYAYEKGNSITIEDLWNYCDKFDCDMDYLLGKQECKKRQSEDICKATGLSEPAADTLCSLFPDERKALDDILIHPSFRALLRQSAKMVYGHAQTFSSRDADTIFGISKEHIMSQEETKSVREYQVSRVLSSILNDVYEDNKLAGTVIDDYDRRYKQLVMIKLWKTGKLPDYSDEKMRCGIDTMKTKIYVPWSFISHSTEDIIDNIDQEIDQLGEEYSLILDSIAQHPGYRIDGEYPTIRQGVTTPNRRKRLDSQNTYLPCGD